MTRKANVEGFLSSESVAFFGASREGRKFGNYAYKELRSKGYKLFPVHPKAEKIEGDKCYTSLSEIEEPIDAAFVSLKPQQTENVVRDLCAAGVKKVWIQQGAESEEAVQFCLDNEMKPVHGECILMFAEPVKSFHAFHRWFWKILGKLPK